MDATAPGIEPPKLLTEALRGRGVISYDQLDTLLTACGFKGRTSDVLKAIGTSSQAGVDPDEFLSWLYDGSAHDSGVAAVIRAAGACDADRIEKTPSQYCNNDIAKMKQMMEVRDNLQEAFDEYKLMAQKLVDDFRSRGKNPQAEAFIEQVCVEKILEGCLFVGHVKTDLDSVAGAIGGACLWRGVATRAERKVNGEIEYALKFAGLELPPFFDDVPGAVTPDSSGELLNVCLVDHNEDKQMVESLRKDPNKSNRICGLIDHHCLSESFNSQKPIFMDIRPWGSMSTIVAHCFIRSNRPMPKQIARILLAAILSDTLNLKSVTTTTADEMMVTLLSILGEVDNPTELAKRMFRAKTEWIVNLGAYEMTRGDQKDFTCCGWKVGIAVLEVTDPTPVLEIAEELLLELRILKIDKGKCHHGGRHDRRRELDFSYLFVVNVTEHTSVLLICGGRELALARLAFAGCKLRAAKPGLRAPGEIIEADETLLEVGPMVSRKAEFVPAFFQALSAGFKCHKHPMADLNDTDAFTMPQDEVFKAIKQMPRMSVHNSVHVVRDYSKLTKAYTKRSSKVLQPLAEA